MQKVLTVGMAVLLCAGLSFAQRITEATDNWTFGPNQPTIQSGTRGDGSTGNYHYLPVGTSAYYFEVATEGEGLIEFWIYDPFKCSADPDPGYGVNGMRWGIQNGLYQALTVGDSRASYVSGCIGYSPWATSTPYSHTWFKDGIRGANEIPWAAGWFKWTINGTFDAATFILYNVTYFPVDGAAGRAANPAVTGDCAQTYDATSFAAMWAALFGSGWKAFWLKGDVASTGIEDPYADVVGGTGVFAEFGTPTIGVARTYNQTSWGNIKSLFK
jgi:hypothetical protein